MINRGCLRCVGTSIGDLDFVNLALVGVWWGRSYEPGFYLCTHPASSGAQMLICDAQRLPRLLYVRSMRLAGAEGLPAPQSLPGLDKIRTQYRGNILNHSCT